MTLDEIEQFAQAVRSTDPNHQELVLARFALAVLPVVRAAEAWERAGADNFGVTYALCDAIETMRAAFDGDKR